MKTNVRQMWRTMSGLSRIGFVLALLVVRFGGIYSRRLKLEIEAIRASFNPGLMVKIASLLAVAISSVFLSGFDLAQAGSFPYGPGYTNILIFSDLHFDPYRGYTGDTNLTELGTNISNPENYWARSNCAEIYGGKGPDEDSSWYLIQSALTNACTNCLKPAAILCLGDFMAHDLSDTNHPNDAKFETEKIMANLFQATFPGTPILPILGNNDSTSDYFPQSGEFLKNFEEAWSNAVPAAPDGEMQNSFGVGFVKGGNYVASVGFLTNVEFVCFDSAQFAIPSKYKANAINYQSAAECEKQLEWIADRLAQATTTSNKVWLLSHVPPGVDFFNGSNL